VRGEERLKGVRVEKHNIKKTHPMWKTIDCLCFKSKNLYNYANYIIRQEFFKNKIWIRDRELDKMIQSHDPYKELGSQAAQKTLQLLDKNWKSFFVSLKDWSKNPCKYLGKPKLPKYKSKNGRYILSIKNIQCRIENGYLIFSWKPLKAFKIKTNVTDKLMQVRFVPKESHYVLEIVYEIDVPECSKESSRIVGIDLGIGNFATLSNNSGIKPFIINGKGIKSINQYYNKKKAILQSELMLKEKKHWSNRLQRLTDKRNNKIDCFLHKSSKYIADWCIENQIDTIVIGRNKEWKQESSMGDKVNQNFINIPHYEFIKKLKYKCENVGIVFIETEESYTSGTSFLDGEMPVKENYDKSRRISRGLFKSNNSRLINADLNGAYQIIKKAFPNALVEGIEDVDLHPVRVNLI
jgi:putative transposase